MKIHTYVLCIALLIASVSCWSQDKSFHAKPTERDKIPPAFFWTKERWQGDDQPYTSIRKEIDSAIKAGGNRHLILREYTRNAQLHPRDPHAIFAWDYAVYKLGTTPASSKEESEERHSADTALDDIPSPHTYEYMRLRFLRDVSNFATPYYRRLGERLIKHNRNDYEVIFYEMMALTPGLAKEDFEQALALQKELIRLRPQDPHNDSSLGWIYARVYMCTDKQSDMDKAFAAYRQCIQKSKPGDGMLPYAKSVMKSLETIRILHSQNPRRRARMHK